MTVPVPAATLVLVRPAAGPADDLLMVERAAAMAFAGGARVFPGGRVDPGDRALAVRFPALDPEDAAARIAAIRETIEEVGIAVALLPRPDADATRRLRFGLAAGEPLGVLLAEEALALDPTALTPYARWCPNFAEARNFDTRFYLAAAPAGSVATTDGGECVAASWTTAAAALASADRGDTRIIFPTRCNLERLAGTPRLADAMADAARYPPVQIVPHVADGMLHIPDGLGYPVTARPTEVARRR